MVYQGGKSRISRYICPIIQRYIDNNHITTFIDAFVGGASIIQNIRCENRIGYDTNPYLIAVLNNLDKVQDFTIPIDKKEYDRCRTMWRNNDHTEPDWYIGLVGFIGSFGGKFYNGGWGKNEYNQTPRKGRHDEKKRNLLAQAPFLQDCTFEVKSFFELDVKDTVIYCDPPYASTTSYPYDDYSSDKFWAKAKELSRHNTVFVSELSAPEGWQEIWHKEIKNTLSATSNVTPQNEKLFVYRGD